jgi:glycosyltransferase involved in cell wall biosynthesis
LKKLAIITTHPIQYNAPWFKLLAHRNNVSLKVFYTWGQLEREKKFDPGFAKKIEWDLPLLNGYDFTFVKNISKDPGTHHFQGIINPTLNEEIQAWGPDIILVIGWSFNSHLKCLRYFHKKIPIIFRGDSTLIDEIWGTKRILRKYFLKWVYNYIDYALYTGTNNKKYFIKYGLLRHQLIFAAHAIDNDRFGEPDNDYQNEADSLRGILGINEEDVVILFAGKMELKKNPLFLISLLKNITNKRLKIVYTGNGVLLEQIKSAAANDERLLVMGFQNQLRMPVIYRVADLFILPSQGPGETWGLSLNEAMASGKAIAACNKVGGAVDLIDDGVNGIIFSLENTDRLEWLIHQALDNKRILRNMGIESKIKIRPFSFDNIVIALENLIYNLAKQQNTGEFAAK